MGKILIYRRGGLGDTLLTFPVVELLNKKGFSVHYVGNTDYLKLLNKVGWVEKIYSELPFNLDIYRSVVLFSKENFLNTPKVRLVNPFPPKGTHALEHYLRELNLTGSFSRVFPLKGSNQWNGKVILHPGSGSPKKNAPLELFIELYFQLKDLKLNPLFVLGEAEENLLEVLKDFSTYRVNDILKFAELLKGSKAFVGNDSGFTHLASYLGVPTVALFGPTDPAEWGPIGFKTAVIYKHFSCSPCFPKVCSANIEKECLKVIKAEEVLTALEKLLSN